MSCDNNLINNLQALAEFTGVEEGGLTYYGTQNMQSFIYSLQKTNHNPRVAQDEGVQSAMQAVDDTVRELGYDAPSFRETPWQFARWLQDNAQIMDKNEMTWAMKYLGEEVYNVFGRVANVAFINSVPGEVQGDNSAFAKWLTDRAPENNLTRNYPHWSTDPYLRDGFDAMLVHFDPPQGDEALSGMKYAFGSYRPDFLDAEVARDEEGRIVMLRFAWDPTKSRRFREHGAGPEIWRGELQNGGSLFAQLRHGTPPHIRGSRAWQRGEETTRLDSGEVVPTIGPGEQVWSGPRDDKGRSAPEAVTVAFGYVSRPRDTRRDNDPAGYSESMYTAVEDYYSQRRKKAEKYKS